MNHWYWPETWLGIRQRWSKTWIDICQRHECVIIREGANVSLAMLSSNPWFHSPLHTYVVNQCRWVFIYFRDFVFVVGSTASFLVVLLLLFGHCGSTLSSTPMWWPHFGQPVQVGFDFRVFFVCEHCDNCELCIETIDYFDSISTWA